MRLRDRLSYKQVKYTVSVAFILGLIFSVFQVTHDYKTQDKSIDSAIQAYLDISKAPASRIAYNLDEELAIELVNGLIESPLILSAAIIDTDNLVLAKAGTAKNPDEQRQFTDLFFGTARTYQQQLSVPYDLEEELGTLTITADTRPSGQEFLDRSVLTLVFGLVRTLLLALALQGMFYLMLTQPLLKLARHVKQVRTGSKHKTLAISGGHQKDEIGLLTSAFNEFQDDIEKQLYHRNIAENKLRQHSHDLELRIADRTQELQENNNALFKANAELEKARQAALRSARIRGEQLSYLSHEIRTPLNGILGMLELTINEELTDKQYERLDLARQSGVRLVRLLNSMLDLARLESGKVAIEHTHFNLREIIEESVVLLSQKTYEKNIPLTCDIDPTLPATLLGDPTRISQVINNLLGNAIKFTHQGEIKLSLDSKPLGQNRLDVIINITDTGIGIPKKALEAIFTPFTQASNAIYDSYGGSGMGLALTKELVKAMNGSISVISREQQGSTFSIKLPLTKPEQITSAATISLENHPILLACEESTQQICHRLLSYWNVPCRIVEPDDSGLDIDCDSTESLIITDQPSLALNMAQHHPQCKTIFISYEQPSEMPDNLLWLSLPVTQQKLYQKCAEVIGINSPGNRSPESINHPPHATDHQQPAFRKKRILVVEDNAINQLVTEGMLEQLGYNINLANNGQDCITACTTEKFDLILMDCNMPVMDGYAATKQLRKMTNTRQTPIIALTANTLEEHKERCRDAGMNGHIAKPFNKKALDTLLNRWLE
ncbi:ATP-binding protein [Endozoicomonas sp. GU-1]|uniref:ATP-binding protein n=2 Tax=Endozoicomonas sp. GU-1 TaxID=3009078 RepID=UPI0022B55D5F|nr:ATP-binding protein [Endozoicomonas sp. GU-1]WBA80542.1 ATP-binding protein [Endozoicomonas sp. GU-1]